MKRAFAILLASLAACRGAGEPKSGLPEATFPKLRYYAPIPRSGEPLTISADVVVYGGTSGGIAAAIQAKRMGKRVVLVEFGERLGGLSTGGLGATDIGNKVAIGGISREFYRLLGKHYGKEEQWTFEPHVAEKTFATMLEGIEVHRLQRLAGVRTAGGAIVAIEMESGNVYRGKAFIDATYEGDLLARAGVSFTVGREPNAQHGETLNGVYFGDPNHNFKVPVDPYVKEGDPASGLLKGISAADPGRQGEGDPRVQAYNFRLCLTQDPANRAAIPKPAGYDPARYELLLRYIQAGVWDAMRLHSKMPNGKTDLNNFGGFSTDNIGRNYGWPNGSYLAREKIFQDHVTYQMGLLWFLAHDERVPEKIRKEVGSWGLCRDEFPETGGWSHQLYVREARRMISDYVMTEANCRGTRAPEDSVGLGAYGMDSHNCNRVVREGRVVNEGNVEVKVPKPYPISYRSIVPKESEGANLLVPVCLSASHIAYGSIRMEPVFMVLGQSAATAACLAIDAGVPVQRVDPAKLRARLLADGQVLEVP